MVPRALLARLALRAARAKRSLVVPQALRARRTLRAVRAKRSLVVPRALLARLALRALLARPDSGYVGSRGYADSAG